jgi:hypothetical protein
LEQTRTLHRHPKHFAAKGDYVTGLKITWA